MMKNNYKAFVRALPILLLFLIAAAATFVVSAQEVANNIIIPSAADTTGAAAVQWDYKPILIAWIVAIAIGVGVVEFWKYKMNTVFSKHEADTYVVPNSLNFKVKTDTFLYSHVTKIRRQTQNRSR
jgi:phosphate/sulfate permease